MKNLITTPNLPNPDDAYAALLKAHEGLSEAQSVALNTKLVLLLANHIGDVNVLAQALDAAKASA